MASDQDAVNTAFALSRSNMIDVAPDGVLHLKRALETTMTLRLLDCRTRSTHPLNSQSALHWWVTEPPNAICQTDKSQP
jgi:hypothetical protein